MSPQRRPPDATDEFLTVAEVAETLKLNQQTIRNWIDFVARSVRWPAVAAQVRFE